MGTGLLTTEGYDPKRLVDVKSDMESAFRSEFAQSMKLSTDTPEGKLVGIFSSALTELWERSEAIYQAAYPAGASGISLDRLAELTGINRRDATRSTGTAYLRGNATVLSGSLISVDQAGDQFRTTVETIIPSGGDITLSAGTADLAITSITRSGTVATVTTTSAHGLVTGSIVTIGGVAGPGGGDPVLYNVTAEITVTGGSTFTYNMTGTPTGTATGTPVYQDAGLASDHILLADIVARSSSVHGLTTGDYVFIFDADQAEYNGVFPCIVLDTTHFQYTPLLAPTVVLATGTFAAANATSVLVESSNTGPVLALAGTLTQIDTPVSGWDGVGNHVAMLTGLNEETDAEFRIRRIAALQGLGNATPDAIRGDLLLIEGVLSVTVFENDTDVIDSGSRPPHSIEVLVDGGTDADIAQAIWDSKAGGIATFGTESDTATDSQGNSQTMNFSRPIDIPIYLDITLTVDSDYPAGGDASVETAVLAWALTLEIGEDVIVYPYLVGSFDGIPGIVTIVIDIGIAPAPSGDANIVIAETERASFSAANTTVTSS